MAMSEKSRIFKIRHGFSLTKAPRVVPVVDRDGVPLMPTSLTRAKAWVRKGKATYFYRKGIYCVRLNVEPTARHYQRIVLANDTGSHFDGFSLKSHHSTHFNMMAESDNDIKDRMESRKNMRRNRRQRHCPYRKCRPDRQGRFKLDKKDPIQSQFNKLPPSTRARWEFRLNVIKVLKSLFPITDIVIEDIQASTRKKKSKKTYNWNGNFSPLEVGKWAFYTLVQHVYPTIKLHLFQGFQTSETRQSLGLPKATKKHLKVFWTHCVDSWTLAYLVVGNKDHVIDNTSFYYKTKYAKTRRQLHRFQANKKGKRPRYGGSVFPGGFLKGDLIRHNETKKMAIVCGSLDDRLVLMPQGYGPRYCRNAKPEEYSLISHNAWRMQHYIHLINMPPRPEYDTIDNFMSIRGS